MPEVMKSSVGKNSRPGKYGFRFELEESVFFITMLIIIQKVLPSEKKISRNLSFWFNGFLLVEGGEGEEEDDQESEETETRDERQVI